MEFASYFQIGSNFNELVKYMYIVLQLLVLVLSRGVLGSGSDGMGYMVTVILNGKFCIYSAIWVH